MSSAPEARGAQAPDATPPFSQDQGSRARSTIHSLPAEYLLSARTSCHAYSTAGWGPRACGRRAQTDPAAARKLWGSIDHIVTDQAAWVPIFNESLTAYFVSARVGNYQDSGYYIGPLLDQIWVR